MNKIATLKQLIIDCQTIRDAVIAENKGVTRNYDYDYYYVYWTYHLPISFQMIYEQWKKLTERIAYQLGDMITLQKIREEIDKIDSRFECGYNIIKNNKDNIHVDEKDKENAIDDINFRFDEVMACLNRLENLCEDEFSNKVFVVHGHSELLIAQTESFLQKLGFEPIILRNQANQGKTIIEKLESNTDVPFAIVLYTGCDEGRFKDDNELLKPRARQNVVFEHGFLNAKLGRNRVCALYEEGVEYPGDLSGVVYIPIDKNGAWKIRVAKEMKAVGLGVDLNKVNI